MTAFVFVVLQVSVWSMHVSTPAATSSTQSIQLVAQSTLFLAQVR